HDAAVLAEQLPALAGVVGAIESTLVCFDDRVHAFRIRRRHRNANLAHHVRQSVGEARPRVAAISGLPDPTPRAAAPHLPWYALLVPHRRVQDARVRRVHRELTGPT